MSKLIAVVSLSASVVVGYTIGSVMVVSMPLGILGIVIVLCLMILLSQVLK